MANTHRPGPVRSTLLAALAALVLSGCGPIIGAAGGADDPPRGPAGTPGPGGAATAGGHPNGAEPSEGTGTPAEQPDGPTDQPSDQPSEGPSEGPSTAGPSEGPTPDSGPRTDPSGPDLVLWSLPECAWVPQGSPSGADVLTLFVAIRNAGPGSYSGLVPYRVSSDTGLSGSGNAAISEGSATSPLQVELSAGDLGRTHRFTVVADPDNAVVERDETNNGLTIEVTMPAAGAPAGDVSCR